MCLVIKAQFTGESTTTLLHLFLAHLEQAIDCNRDIEKVVFRESTLGVALGQGRAESKIFSLGYLSFCLFLPICLPKPLFIISDCATEVVMPQLGIWNYLLFKMAKILTWSLASINLSNQNMIRLCILIRSFTASMCGRAQSLWQYTIIAHNVQFIWPIWKSIKFIITVKSQILIEQLLMPL